LNAPYATKAKALVRDVEDILCLRKDIFTAIIAIEVGHQLNGYKKFVTCPMKIL